MGKIQMRNSLLLLLTAIIWGVAFVAQSVGMEYVGAFTFNCTRSLIGGLVLIPCIVFLKNRARQEAGEQGRLSAREALHVTRTELIGGICCGLALCAASNFQQVGLAYTTVGKAGFITALYVVIVPIIGLFFKKKVSIVIWIGVFLSVIGLYLLCMTGNSFSISFGDGLVLICAVLFSIHILIIDHFSPKGDGVVISCIQFFVCGLVSAVPMFLLETPKLMNILAAWMPILYAGVLSCGVAYTLQIVAQKGMNPTVASLILCLESVVSALAGWIILGQALNVREMAGCFLMFLAIVLAQLPIGQKESGDLN